MHLFFSLSMLLLPHSPSSSSSMRFLSLAPFLTQLFTLILLIQCTIATTTTTNTSDTPSPPSLPPSTLSLFRSFLLGSSGITPSHFFTHVFESHPFIAHRNASHYYSVTSPVSLASGFSSRIPLSTRGSSLIDLHFGLAELGMILDTTGTAFGHIDAWQTRMTYDDVRAVRRVKAADGEYWSAVYPLEQIPAHKPIDAAFAQQALGRGFTLVLNRFNFRWEAVAMLCERLTRDLFGFRIQSNLYLTPRNSSGFEAHFDWQESIVLQLSGSKRWNIFQPPLITLPRADQKFKPRRAVIETAASDKQVETLTPGSMMYFPSGFIHEATTTAAPKPDSESANAAAADEQKNNSSSTADEILPTSMHITLGIEIDPLFTMQGLLHLFINEMQQHDSAIHQQLLSPLPPCTCTSEQPGPISPLNFLDVLQWIAFDLSSRTVESSTYPSHAFRKSLWGLHWWNETEMQSFTHSTEAASVKIPLPPANRSLAEVLLTPEECDDILNPSWTALSSSSRRSIAFHISTASRLHRLLILIESTRFDLINPLNNLIRIQSRINGHSKKNTSNKIEFTNSSHPSQTKYEFETIFNDEAILSYVNKSMHSTQLTQLLELKGDTELICVQTYLNSLEVSLRHYWGEMMRVIDFEGWTDWELQLVARRESNNQSDIDSIPLPPTESITDQPSWPLPLSLLTPSFSFLHSTLLSSTTAHLSNQRIFLDANISRQKIFLENTRKEYQRQQKDIAAARKAHGKSGETREQMKQTKEYAEQETKAKEFEAKQAAAAAGHGADVTQSKDETLPIPTQ